MKRNSFLKYRNYFLVFLLLPLAELLFLLPLPNAFGQLEYLPQHQSVDENAKSNVLSAFGKLPLHFVANQGQLDKAVIYYAKSEGATVYCTEEGLTFGFAKGSISLKFSSESPVKPEARGELSGKVNYFIGNDQTSWQRDIPTFGEVVYRSVYPGIDLVYSGDQRRLKYTFYLHPGSKPEEIQMVYDGIEGVWIDGATGELVIQTEWGEMRDAAPIAYQDIEGVRRDVDISFRLMGEKRVGFAVGDYNPNFMLTIDPGYSTYLGGTSSDSGYGIAVDSSGSVYVAGYTSSSDFPTQNPYQSASAGNNDIFVTKLSSSGNTLIYSTYLGGSSFDYGTGIAVDSSNNAYITGTTASSDFPTQNPFQGSHAGGVDGEVGGGDIFVTKLSSSGNTLSYSTYLGGSGIDFGGGIAVDSSNNAYITGSTRSSDFPTQNPFQDSYGGSTDVFATKLSGSGNTLNYSTYLGGSNSDYGYGIAVDSSGNAYITGSTISSDFPTQNPFQGTSGGTTDVFATKLSSSGNTLIYSTYLGGSSSDSGTGIAVDSSNNAYIIGNTDSYNFPTQNPFQDGLAEVDDVFVTKLSSTGNTLSYSTYLGGGFSDYGTGIAVDSNGNAYVTGYTYSSYFPTQNPYQGSKGGSTDAFVTKLSSSGSTLSYSTYLGGGSWDYGRGIAVDGEGNTYITGNTNSSYFPTLNAYQSNLAETSDTFVTNFTSDGRLVVVPSITSVNPSSRGVGATGQTIVITGASFQDSLSVAFESLGTISIGTTTKDSDTQITLSNVNFASATAGTGSIRVTNPNDESTTADFTVNTAPGITSINPSSRGIGATGQTIVISGSNFQDSLSVAFESLGTISIGTTTKDSATQITLSNVDFTNATAGTGTIRVTNPDAGTTTSGFTVNAAPSITSVNPSSRGVGATGQTIVIIGSSFQDSLSVAFEGLGTITIGTTTKDSDTQITLSNVDFTSATAGTGTIRVTNPDAGTTTSGFTVNAAPNTTSINPSSRGVGVTGQTIVITGSSFQDSLSVAFEGLGTITIGTTTKDSDTQITLSNVDFTNATAGTGTIRVTNQDAGTATASFAVNPAPNITNVNPSTAINNENNKTIVITGSGFQNGLSVAFEGLGTVAIGTTTKDSATQITLSSVDFTNATAGAGTVRVTNPDAGTATSAFTVYQVVVFPDSGLEAAIVDVLGIAANKITTVALASLTSLNASERSISDLTGLEYCTNLTYLNLGTNEISNISQLQVLTSLTGLVLDENQISNISPLENLTSLTALEFYHNQLSDISPLQNLTSLDTLDLSSNQLSDISPLQNLTNLYYLDLSSNEISNISPLQNLNNLEELYLDINRISDLGPLVANPGGDYLYVTENPLSSTSVYTHIPTLEELWNVVNYDEPPVITTINPSNQAVGATGQTIVITGSNFQTGLSVAFEGLGTVVIGTTTRDNDTQITLTNVDFTNATAGTGTVRVANSNQGTTNSTFTVNPAPSITNVNPSSALVGDSNKAIAIAGSGFQDSLAVTFEGLGTIVIGTTTKDSATQITLNNVDFTNATSGSGTIRVTNPDAGTVATSFTVGANIPDANLEATIRDALDQPEGMLTAADLAILTSLDASEQNISNLTGLEYCTNLTTLYLSTNQISDISALQNLTSLTVLRLYANQISDIGALQNLTSLTGLYLNANQISDVSALQGLTNLTVLGIYGNQISDIGALQNLTSLTNLYLDDNQITDLAPLVANTALDTGDYVNVKVNPLSSTSINTHIPVLQDPDRGVTVEYDEPPVITSVNPSSRAVGTTGQTIVITGSNFQDGISVAFEGLGTIVIGTTTKDSATQITLNNVDFTEAVAGSGTIRVTNSNKGTTTSAFTVNLAPSITSINPSSRGVGATGQTIVITGSNFQEGISVAFEGLGTVVIGTTTKDSDTQITLSDVDFTNATGGTGTIRVTNPDAGTTTAGFTVNAAPSITSINPSSRGVGATGQTIITTGTNFQEGISVAFEGIGTVIIGTTTKDSATQITLSNVDFTNATGGTGTIRVTNLDAGTTTSGFTVNTALSIISINPSSRGVGATGQTIVITGSNFQEGISVAFEGLGTVVIGTTTKDSDTQITLSDVDFTNATGGTGTIRVTNPDAGTITAGFTVNAAPIIEAINPPSRCAGTTGQTIVTTGSGFQEGLEVTFEGLGTIVIGITTVDNATQITLNNVDFTNATAGSGNIRITNPDSGTVVSQFTVNPAPNITNVNPSSALISESNKTIAITGSGFQEGPSVMFEGFGTIVIGTTTVDDATQITLTDVDFTDATTGDGTIRVTNPDAGTTTAAFTVLREVNIPDSGLDAALREALEKAAGALTNVDLATLTSLIANGRNISNLSGLEYCTNLAELDLSRNQISDINPIQNITKLTKLLLYNNHITDISALQNLTSLTRIHLNHNKIINVSALSNLTGLTFLYLSSNQISNVSVLQNFTALKWLGVEYNQIIDVSPIQNLTGLTNLYFSGNHIIDISVLQNLINLTELYLSHNRISDISALQNLANLTMLYLRNNQISDISVLQNLQNLRQVELENNQIIDLQALFANSGLADEDYVNVQGNPLNKDSLNTYIPALQMRGVTVRYDEPPIITSVNPSSRSVGATGQTIVINGSNFQDSLSVTFEGLGEIDIGTTTRDSDMKITLSNVDFTNATVGTGTIRVTTSDFTNATVSNGTVRVMNSNKGTTTFPFTVNPAPRITNINPSSARVDENNKTVVITGSNFQDGLFVTFEGLGDITIGTTVATGANGATQIILSGVDFTDANIGTGAIRVENPDAGTTTATFTVEEKGDVPDVDEPVPANTLYLKKTADKEEVAVNEDIIYTLEYGNKGSAFLTNVEIKDMLPKELEWIEGGNYIASEHAVVFSIASLPPQANGKITYKTSVTDCSSETNEIVSTASIVSKEASLPLFASPLPIPIIPSTTLSVVGNKTSPAPGEQLEYTITYANEGGKSLDTIIRDRIPANTTYVSTGGNVPGQYSEETGEVVWNLGVLNYKDSGVLTLVVRINDDVQPGTIIENVPHLTNDRSDEITGTTSVKIPPSVTISPLSGIIGTEIEVRGHGYYSNENVRIDFGQTVGVITVQTNQLGKLIGKFTVDIQPGGIKQVKTTGLSSSEFNVVTFTIQPSLVSIVSGSDVELRGHGYNAYESIRVDVGQDIGVAEIEANDKGSFITKFSLDDKGTDEVLVEATGLLSKTTAQTTFRNFTLMGRVIDANTSKPIEGAIVTVDGISDITDAEGKYELALKPGDYTITVSADEYEPQEKNTSINPGEVIVLDFTTEQGSITGEVDTDGVELRSGFLTGGVIDAETSKPIKGAVVTVDGSSVETNSEGKFHLSLPPGQHDVSISAKGYLIESKQVEINPEGTEELFLPAAPALEVWPGDTDNDRKVSVLDILPIGRFWNRRGDKRTPQEVDETEWQRGLTPIRAWEPDEAAFADADGNGIVDKYDVLIIARNWKKGRSKVTSAPASVDYTKQFARKELLDKYQKMYQVLNKAEDSEGAIVLRKRLSKLIANLKPKESMLFANYPNPFNPDTWIPFELAEASDVTFRIYDAKGSLVNEIFLGRKLAGSYITKSEAMYWDGKNNRGEQVAGGVYFYTLHTEYFTFTRKMTVVK